MEVLIVVQIMLEETIPINIIIGIIKSNHSLEEVVDMQGDMQVVDMQVDM
jgi:hypothetical protein